jgi:uncharacterized membrane protein YdjX (TVP38/TMEM64 family)
MNLRLLSKILALLVLVTLGTYLFLHYNWYVYFVDRDKAIQLITSFHPYDEIFFILLQIIQVVAAPIPGEATGLIGGYLYGPYLGTLYSTIGLTIGSWIAFILARFFGMPLVEKAVSAEVIRKFDQFMEHQGAFVSFLLFLIPGFPKDYLCYIMGVSHMSTLTFIVISTAGRLMGTAMLSVCGHCVRSEQYLLLFIVIAASVIIIIPAIIYREKLLTMLKRWGRASKTNNDKKDPE